MLRFSDSKLGGISTAYAAKSEDGTVDVKHLEPDTLKILQVKKCTLIIIYLFILKGTEPCRYGKRLCPSVQIISRQAQTRMLF